MDDDNWSSRKRLLWELHRDFFMAGLENGPMFREFKRKGLMYE